MGMVDNLTSPILKVTNATKKSGETIQKTQDKIAQLNKAAGDIDHFKQLKSATASTRKELETAQAKVGDLAKQMKAVTSPTKKMTAEFNRAKAMVTKLKAEHQSETDQLQKLRSRLSDAGVSTSRLNESMKRLRKETAGYNNELQKEQGHLDKIAQRQKTLSSIKSNTGSAAAAISGVVGGVSVAGLSGSALEAQKAGSQLAAMQGEGRLSAEKYRDIITQVYGSTTYSIDQTAEAIAAITSLLGGLDKTSAKTIVSLTGKTAALSQAYGLAATESMQTATQMVKNGLVQNIDQAFDLIGGGLQKMSTSMRSELPDILNEYGVHFKGMGFSGSEAIRLIVDASKSGKIALDKTGDAIKEFSIRGSDMSKSSVEAYDEIGLSASEMSNAIVKGGKGARDALTKTAKGLLNIKDPASRANAAIALFGTPLEDLAVDKIPDFLNAMVTAGSGMGDLSGTVDKLSDTLNKNGLSSIQLLGKALNGSMMKVFNDLEPQIIAVTSAVKGFVENNPKIIAATVAISAFIATLAAVGGIVSLAITALSGFGVILTTVKLMTSLLTFEQMKLTASMVSSRVITLASAAALLVLSSAQTAIAASISVMTIAQRALNAAFITSPIGLIILGITALIGVAALVVKYWTPISSFFTSLWGDLKTTFSIGLEFIKSIFAWTPLGAAMQGWGSLSGFFGGLWSGIKNIFSVGWEFIKSVMMFSPLGLVMQSWEPLSAFFSGLWSRISGMFSKGMTQISGVLGTVSDWWGSLFGGDDNTDKKLNVTKNMTQMATVLPATVNPTAIPSVSMPPHLPDTNNIGEPATLSPVTSPVPARTSQPRMYTDNSTVTFTIHAAPGMDERELAKQVDMRLEYHKRQADRASRTTAYDV